MDYMAPLKAFHAEHIEPYIGKAVGSFPEEVDALEKAIGFEFPLAYRQFLLWMGNDGMGIFRGSDNTLRWVINNTKNLPSFLQEMEQHSGVDLKLPKHYLSFFSHQGYSFTWFELPKTDDNPLVYWFNEILIDDPEAYEPPREIAIQAGGRFTDYVFRQMEGMSKYLGDKN